MKTVAELIEELQKLPPDAVIVKSRDSEGNGYSEVWDLELGRWDSEEKEFGLYELTPELIEKGYSEEDVKDGPVAVCLW